MADLQLVDPKEKKRLEEQEKKIREAFDLFDNEKDEHVDIRSAPVAHQQRQKWGAEAWPASQPLPHQAGRS